MGTTPRFVMDPDYCSRFVLADDVPWRHAKLGWKYPAVRVGWRCYCKIPPGLSEHALQFAEASKSAEPWATRGQYVNVTIDAHPDCKGYGMPLVIDLWVEKSRNTVDDIQAATTALEVVRREIEAQLRLDSIWHLAKQQEFLDVELPPSIARHLDSDRARAAIVALLETEKRIGDLLPTLNLLKRRLTFGPEHGGTIEAVQRYLERETGERPKRGADEPALSHLQSWIALMMAATILLTWSLPLRPWSIAVVTVVLTGLFTWGIVPRSNVPWKSMLRQTPTVASIGFFGIGMFGIGYAVCALLDHEALGPVSRLGYPFLVSTGLGIAGGILGDNPKGAARILAHIQLLLFLGGLMGVVAVLFRIDRGTRQRG